MTPPVPAKGRKPTRVQLNALRAVAAGRVTYGDPHPKALARRHALHAGTESNDIAGRPRTRPTALYAYALPVWMLDGHEVYGGQHATYGSLDVRGWVTCGQRDDCGPAPVALTAAGRSVLDSSS